MGRKQSNTVDYFPHFVKQGKTLYVLKGRYGNNGYAFWFQLLEMLCDEEGHTYDCRSADAWQYLLARTGVTEAEGEDILALLASMGKIDPALWEHRVIWCENLAQNLERVYQRRGRPLPRPTKASYISAPKTGISAPEMGISAPEIRQSKVKHSKVKESREGISAPENSELLTALLQLPGWTATDGDETWLSEFIQDYSFLSVAHVKSCRDYHAHKPKHNQGLWKTRLRNWMMREKPIGGNNDRQQRPKTSRAFADVEID